MCISAWTSLQSLAGGDVAITSSRRSACWRPLSIRVGRDSIQRQSHGENGCTNLSCAQMHTGVRRMVMWPRAYVAVRIDRYRNVGFRAMSDTEFRHSTFIDTADHRAFPDLSFHPWRGYPHVFWTNVGLQSMRAGRPAIGAGGFAAVAGSQTLNHSLSAVIVNKRLRSRGGWPCRGPWFH